VPKHRICEHIGAAPLWDGCDAAVASRLAYPEVRAALAAAARSQLQHQFLQELKRPGRRL
jgi:hypothetical protein